MFITNTTINYNEIIINTSFEDLIIYNSKSNIKNKIIMHDVRIPFQCILYINVSMYLFQCITYQISPTPN